MTTEIKPYEPMGFMYTHGDQPKNYYMPLADIERILKEIDKPNGPRFIDLSKYGYGTESASMIRGHVPLDEVEGEAHFELLKEPNTAIRQRVRFVLEDRAKQGFLNTRNTIHQLLHDTRKDYEKSLEYSNMTDYERVRVEERNDRIHKKVQPFNINQ